MAKSFGTKLYYSIGKVAELTELAPYTLRAWESEFSCLRPKRMRGKNRAYRQRDIAIILLIRRLLHEERYSTRGAQQKLRNEPDLIHEAVAHVEGLEAGVPPSLAAAAADGTTTAAAEPCESTPAVPQPASAPPAPAPSDGPVAEAAAEAPRETPSEPVSEPPTGDPARQLLAEVRRELRGILDLLR